MPLFSSYYSLLRICVFGQSCLKRFSLLQSGSGCGVGAAAGAAGPSRESQCVLGAPRSGHHRPLLGHQHTQSVCGGLGRQGVLSPGRILQTGQGVCVRLPSNNGNCFLNNSSYKVNVAIFLKASECNRISRFKSMQ